MSKIVPAAVVGAALGVLAASGPVGATIAGGIQIAQAAHDTFSETKRRIENGEPATSALGRAAAQTAVSQAAGQVASELTAAAVPSMLSRAGVAASPQQKHIITAAVAGAVGGMVP